MPFLAEKITSMLYNILQNCTADELKDVDEPSLQDKVVIATDKE
jgi:hypothetical protein